MLTLEQIVAIQGAGLICVSFALIWSMIRLPKHSDGVGNLVAKLATLEGENKRLRASSNETHMMSMDLQRRYLRILRDYRFSQNANERHKRANRRLRELPEVQEALAKATAEKRAAYEAKEAYAAKHRVVQGKTRDDLRQQNILDTIPNPRLEEATPEQMARLEVPVERETIQNPLVENAITDRRLEDAGVDKAARDRAGL